MLRIIQKWDLPLFSSKNGKSHGNCHWPDYSVQRLHYLQISHWPLLHKIVCSVKNLGSLFYLIFTLALLNVHSSTAKYLNPFSWHKQGSIYRYFLVSPPPLPSRHRPLPRVAVWATCPALPCPACSASLVTSTFSAGGSQFWEILQLGNCWENLCHIFIPGAMLECATDKIMPTLRYKMRLK